MDTVSSIINKFKLSNINNNFSHSLLIIQGNTLDALEIKLSSCSVNNVVFNPVIFNFSSISLSSFYLVKININDSLESISKLNRFFKFRT